MFYKNQRSSDSRELLLQPFNSDRDHYTGSLIAPLEIVQYGDFQCRFCGELYTTLQLLRHYFGEQLRFVFRHYPMLSLHPLALEASMATEAAAMQGKFWEMHDLIYEHQTYLVRSSFSRFAEELSLNCARFGNSLGYKTLGHKVSSDFDSGVKSGVVGTPTLFLNGRHYTGFHDMECLLSTCLQAMSKSPVFF